VIGVKLETELSGMTKLGFLGVGTIGHAVARGLLETDLIRTDKNQDGFNLEAVVLSPRGTKNVQDLMQVYSSKRNEIPCLRFETAKSNQEVIDSCDWVIVGVHHKNIEEILSRLEFRDSQVIISLASAVSREDIFRYCKKKIKQEAIFRATPLPACRHLHGTTLIYPPNEELTSLFNHLGSTVSVKSSEELLKLQTATAFMGDFYERKVVITNWLCAQGVDKMTSASYVAKLFSTIISDATEACEADQDIFENLVKEQTPG